MISRKEDFVIRDPLDVLKCGAGPPKLTDTIRQKYALLLTTGVLLLCVAAYVLFSFVTVLVILGSYIGGVTIMHAFYSSRFQTFLINFTTRQSSSNDHQSFKSCAVCLTQNCSRHERFGLNQPWEQLEVAAEVDEALEAFMTSTFDKYIHGWYGDISSDIAFLYEMKCGVRYLFAVLLCRAKKIDLPKLITRKLLRVAFCHLDCCLQTRQGKGGEKGGFEEAVFDYYGSDLHLAVYNRSCELRYLHSLSERLLPLLLPPKYLQCRSFTYLIQEILSSTILLSIMDIAADPDIINYLLLIIFEKTPMVHYPPSSRPDVLLLEHFVLSVPPRHLTRLSELCTENPTQQSYLYPLMRFMKKEGTIGILQFCLAADDFSTRLLNPDLNEEDIKLLHQEAKKLYDIYMAPDGVDRLDFSQEIVEQFQSVVNGPYCRILDLQKTEPLYKAHEYAFSVLEKHIGLFCESEEYFEHVCGQKMKNSDKSIRRLSRKNSTLSAAAKLGNKINRIRGVLRPVAAIDGQLEEDAADLADAGFEADEMKLAIDMDSNYVYMDDFNLRDLSAWRVSIPRVENRKEENGKQFCVFVIDVQRIDVTNKDDPDEFHWVVERQHQEFYVLEAKLIEFHGDFVDIHLPSKWSLGAKGLEYMEARRAAFEEFLQRLLQKPTFRGSELLFTFLSSTGDFTKGLLPDIKLGRMIKNVPMKLLKEKGQHLENFLLNFLTSTESVKPKSCKAEYKDIYVYPPSNVVRKLRKSIYADNAGRKLDHSLRPTQSLQLVLRHKGLCDYILYLGLKVLEVPLWSLQLLVAVLRGFGVFIEFWVETYLGSLLKEALVPQRLAFLIHLLKDAIFFRDASKRSDEEKKQRASETLEKAKMFLPYSAIQFLGRERYDGGITKLFNILQHPRLNKQLAYMLLDCVAVELFPELRTVGDSDGTVDNEGNPRTTMWTSCPS